MIIISQDGETIVNFDNVKAIEFDELSDKVIIRALINDEICLAIAKYSSKSVAKKVLNMFQEFYRCAEMKEATYEQTIATFTSRNNGVFAMPEE